MNPQFSAIYSYIYKLLLLLCLYQKFQVQQLHWLVNLIN